jgi:hypothetical protein
LEPEHIIDETATIEGADIEAVYDRCVSWLKRTRSNISQVDKPKLIHANFNSVEARSPDGWSKNITIELEKVDDAVCIHLLMDSPEKLSREFVIRAKAYWPLMVEKLWRFIGVEIRGELLLTLYPITVLEFILDDLRYNLLMSFFVLSSPLLLGIVLGISRYEYLDMRYILGLLLMVFLILMWVGGLQYYQVRTLLRELYPDR